MSAGRRAIALVALVAMGLGACGRTTEPSRGDPAAASAAAPTGLGPRVEPTDAGLLREAAGVFYYERMVGGARDEDRVPMIVALHGLGDAPDKFAPTYLGLRAPARLVIPRGFEGYHDGYRWFDVGDRTEATLAKGTLEAVPHVAAFVEAVTRERPTVGRAVVTGFSQGAILTYALAATRPSLVSVAVPISGFLPPGVAPARLPRVAASPLVFGYHGDDDPQIKLAWAQRGVDELKALGETVYFKSYAGVGHALSTDELVDILGIIDRATAREAKRR